MRALPTIATRRRTSVTGTRLNTLRGVYATPCRRHAAASDATRVADRIQGSVARLAATGCCLAQESHLLLETPARGACIQMQPQASPIPYRQWVVLRVREQVAGLLAVYEVRKAF